MFLPRRNDDDRNSINRAENRDVVAKNVENAKLSKDSVSKKIKPIGIDAVSYDSSRYTRDPERRVYIPEPRAKAPEMSAGQTGANIRASAPEPLSSEALPQMPKNPGKTAASAIKPEKPPFSTFLKRAIYKPVTGAVFVALCAVMVMSAFLNKQGAAYAGQEVKAVPTTVETVGKRDYYAYNPAAEFISTEIHYYIQDGSGKITSGFTPFTDIASVLECSDIELGELDYVNYPLDYMVMDNMLIKITRVSEVIAQDTTPIAYTSKTVDVDSIPKGTTKVSQQGVNGQLTKYYRQTVVDGEVVDSEYLSEEVTAYPVQEIVQRGVGGVFTAPDGTQYNYSYVLNVDAVAYGDVSEGTNPNWTGYTRIGIKAYPGVIAVDPTVIPLRSNVYVIGDYGDYGVCYAADTGGGIKGNIIDIYMETLAEMYQFGRRKMKAYVLE